MIGKRLGLDHITLINDFGAIGHTVIRVGPEHLGHLCGPDVPLPEQGVISIVGPGSGLGVAHVLRRDGHDHVIECHDVLFLPTCAKKLLPAFQFVAKGCKLTYNNDTVTLFQLPILH